MKSILIIGGGTVAHVRNHFAVCAPAYGKTANALFEEASAQAKGKFDTFLYLTRMAGGSNVLETNEDVSRWVDEMKKNLDVKIIFFNCALVDWEPQILSMTNDKVKPTQFDSCMRFGKYEGRLETRNLTQINVSLTPSHKIISTIRQGRKDIFLVAFKTTCGASKQEMYEKGLRLCKEGSVNLVLVNDAKTHWNMIVTPEEAVYHETQDREDVLKNLVQMAILRSHLTFTQSTVVAGEPVSWLSKRVPSSLREIVNYCIRGRAYKSFDGGGTVGHFAVKLSDTEFLTSIRRSNFNKLNETGLVYVKTDGPDSVIAYGAKPSVGGQSQRIVFNDHVGMDCIVHFHCPLKTNPRDKIPVRSQREYECGSHECGKNTSDGLAQFGNLKAVYLDQHGPNIVFNKSIDPKEVIDFIEVNFDLDKKTGGYTF